MPVLTTCPDCSAKMRVPDHAVGKQIKCPKCGGTFTVTAGGASPPPPPPPPAPKPAPVAPTPVAPDPLDQLSGMESPDTAGDMDDAPPRKFAARRGGNTTSDFLAFRLFITPVVIQILFWFGVLACIIAGLMGMYGAIRIAEYNFSGAVIPLLTAMAILVIGPIMVRVQCELTMVFFRMYDTLREIKDISRNK